MNLPFAIFISGKGLALTLGDLRKMGIVPSIRDSDSILRGDGERIEDHWPLAWVDIESTAQVNGYMYPGLTADGRAHFLLRGKNEISK